MNLKKKLLVTFMGEEGVDAGEPKTGSKFPSQGPDSDTPHRWSAQRVVPAALSPAFRSAGDCRLTSCGPGNIADNLLPLQWGMFKHDDDSNLCWFNASSEDLDEFWLVGAVVGLACYNAATLDIPL